MKDLSEVTFFLGIEIFIDRFFGVLTLSHNTYIDHILSKFNMQDCKFRDIPIVKDDQFCLCQCPRYDEGKVMKNISLC